MDTENRRTLQYILQFSRTVQCDLSLLVVSKEGPRDPPLLTYPCSLPKDLQQYNIYADIDNNYVDPLTNTYTRRLDISLLYDPTIDNVRYGIRDLEIRLAPSVPSIDHDLNAMRLRCDDTPIMVAIHNQQPWNVQVSMQFPNLTEVRWIVCPGRLNPVTNRSSVPTDFSVVFDPSRPYNVFSYATNVSENDDYTGLPVCGENTITDESNQVVQTS